MWFTEPNIEEISEPAEVERGGSKEVLWPTLKRVLETGLRRNPNLTTKTKILATTRRALSRFSSKLVDELIGKGRS